VEIARDYLARLEAGQQPQVADYVAQYPDLADAVRSCLEGLEFVHRSVKAERSRAPQANPAAPVLLTEPLGDFKIVRELGRGGMGVVYEAVQSSLGRRVALKVLPFTATLQPKQLQRFLNEAQAAAHLHHPHIVPVFAVGCDRGVHYYAMQLIEGMSLAELLTKLRHDAGWNEPTSAGTHVLAPSRVELPADDLQPHSQSHPQPHSQPGPAQATMDLFSSQLSTQRTSGRSDYFRSVARLGQQAAEALSYAHELGIVHRDIKPANLMLDARGKIWVTDFGLAQMRSGTELTHTGDILGTLRYMSPEQAQGDRTLLDQRTDIYALGATLYELTTLHPLFNSANRLTLLNHVLHEEPTLPRKLNRSVPVELETIILKAVSKSASERYATAQQMAEDLQRFLGDQPILAQRPTLVDHVRKWARRHPSAVMGLVLVFVAMSIGLFIHNRLIAEEQSRTNLALERAKTRAVEAEQSFQQARRAVDLLIQIGEEEMADKPSLQAARKRLLTAALTYYQDFIAQRTDDRASQQELTAVENRVKGILRELSVVSNLFQAMLISEPDVRDDLNLSGSQRTQLAAFQQETAAQHEKLVSDATSPFEERKRRFVQYADSQAKRLSAILTSAQRERLRQIWLQWQSLLAFQEPEVIEALKLTDEQRRQIRSLELQSLFGGSRPLGPPGSPGGFRGPPPPPPREEQERRLLAAKQQVLNLLTPAQVDRWHALIGPDFIGRIGLFLPGFPGGGPPRHGPFERPDGPHNAPGFDGPVFDGPGFDGPQFDRPPGEKSGKGGKGGTKGMIDMHGPGPRMEQPRNEPPAREPLDGTILPEPARPDDAMREREPHNGS